MGKPLFALLFLVVIAITISSCRTERVQVHKNGRIHRMKSKRTSPWYMPAGSGYSRHTNRKLKRWDKGFHK